MLQVYKIYSTTLFCFVGLILIVTKSEETTFWLLKEMVEVIAPEYHTRTMKGLIVDIDVLTELIKKRAPGVNAKVTELGLPWAVISTKWFICLFAEVLPVETVLRIWDCLFAEGGKVSFFFVFNLIDVLQHFLFYLQILFRVSLTLILHYKDEILQTEDISVLAEIFRNVIKSSMAVDCHSFVEKMFKLKLKRRQIEFLRQEIRNQRK